MKEWAGIGEAYSASYAGLCAGTFPAIRSLLGPAGGRTLLDVGSGDGTLAARWSDEGWRARGCEPEPSMRAVSRRRHPDLAVVSGALPELPFADGAADVVIANFVLNHVERPRAAAAELGRVSTECVVATTWTRSPSWFWTYVVDRAGLTAHAGRRLPPSEEFERTADGFGRMLSDGGLVDVEVSEHAWTWTTSTSALWTSVEGGVAGAGAHYAVLDQRGRDAFRAAFDEVAGEYLQDGALVLEHRAAVAVARPGHHRSS